MSAAATNNRSSRRREMDFMKVLGSNKYVVWTSDNVGEFWVLLEGPSETPYEGGKWTLHVILPKEYPFSSPSIGFSNRIYHPNIDEASGSVCLDVINQTWTPMYELMNVFDIFIPQLLRYPNSADPLNPEAASLQLKDPAGYVAKVHEHTLQWANVQKAMDAPLRGGGQLIEDTLSVLQRSNSAVSTGSQHNNKNATPQQQLQSSFTSPAGKAGGGGVVGDSPATNFSRGLTESPPSELDVGEAMDDDEDYDPEAIDI